MDTLKVVKGVGDSELEVWPRGHILQPAGEDWNSFYEMKATRGGRELTINEKRYFGKLCSNARTR